MFVQLLAFWMSQNVCPVDLLDEPNPLLSFFNSQIGQINWDSGTRM